MDYPGLSAFFSAQVNDHHLATFMLCIGISVVMIIPVVIFLGFDRKRKFTDIIWYTCTVSAFLALGYAQILNWQDYSEKKAVCVQQDQENWEIASQLHEKYLVLEEALSHIVQSPNPEILDHGNTQLAIFQPTQLRQCRVITAEVVSPSKVSGTTGGYMPTGGIFGGLEWVNLNQDAMSSPDLRGGQALILWVEHGAAYQRLVFPSSEWIDQQRGEVVKKYTKSWLRNYTHLDEVFVKHDRLLDSLFSEVLAMSTGNVNDLWALLQDRRNQAEDLILDATALTGSFAQNAYFADGIMIQKAAYRPEQMSREIISPGGFALEAYTAITEEFMRQQPR